MCGINGIAFSSRSHRSVDPSVLTRMCDVISYRGPDDSGFFIDGPIGLGHRRLSIVDVAAGHQPMTNEDGSLRITYNCEIYNHADFRSELESKGHVYQTHCDTETILHLYEEYGERCVDFLRGMFAFAIWDQRRKQLFIARDRLGVKPLYYVHTADGSLFFGSEIKTVIEAGAVKPELNFRVLPDYLANHATSGEETLFVGVKRLLPGHTLRWRDGEIKIRKYWDVSFEKQAQAGKSDADYIAEWYDLFRQSVRLRLMADVPLGMFLSGGIDSSAIAAVMSGMVNEPIKTFSVAFNEREANELEYARIVSNAFKTNHHEVVVSPDDFFAALPKLVWHEDEPLAHPSSVALYFVSLLASEHVKVVLTGEGSDELLAGYGRYRKTILNLSLGAKYRRLTPSPLQNALRSGVQGLPSSRARQKLLRSFLNVAPDIESIYFDNFAVFPLATQADLLSPESLERVGRIDPYEGVRRVLGETDAESFLDRLLYTDIKTYLHELLMKQDQMSMATSIESRVPFLDHPLVEFAMRVPDRLKLRGGVGKYIVKKAAEGLVSNDILYRKKMGFPTPIRQWLRAEAANGMLNSLLDRDGFVAQYLNLEPIAKLMERHRAGTLDATDRLWRLLNLQIWGDMYFT